MISAFVIAFHLAFIHFWLLVDNKTRTLKTESLDDKCPHNEIMYNMKLAGGLKAGQFTDIGRVKGVNTCVKYCCDSKVDCDLAFMLGKRFVPNKFAFIPIPSSMHFFF